MNRIYHVGFLKSGTTLTVQLREDIDCLSCELWRYMGRRLTTKAEQRKHKAELLAEVNKISGHDFKHIVID